MKIRHLIGAVDRVVNGVATIVPDDQTQVVYVAERDIPGAVEGLAVDLVIIPREDPNAVCRILGRKPPRPQIPKKMASFSGLVRQMVKTRERLQATLNKLSEEKSEEISEENSEEVDGLKEKLDFLDKGIDIFS